MHIISQ